MHKHAEARRAAPTSPLSYDFDYELAITNNRIYIGFLIMWQLSSCKGSARMNEDQHRRRLVLWFGSFPVIAAFVLLILVALFSDRTVPEVAYPPVGSDPIHQADDASKVINQPSDPLPALSS